MSTVKDIETALAHYCAEGEYDWDALGEMLGTLPDDDIDAAIHNEALDPELRILCESERVERRRARFFVVPGGRR